MKQGLSTRTAAVVAAVFFILFGSLAAAPAYAAPSLAPAPSVVQAADAPENVAGTLAVWGYYDGSHITSAPNCASRLSWLRANVNWITTANSKCQKFTTAACGAGTAYWMVMVLTGTGARAATLPEQTALAAAC